MAVESSVARHDPVHGGQLIVLEGAGVDPGLAEGDLPRRVLEPHVAAEHALPRLLQPQPEQPVRRAELQLQAAGAGGEAGPRAAPLPRMLQLPPHLGGVEVDRLEV